VQTYKVFKTWVVLFLGYQNYPSLEDFESLKNPQADAWATDIILPIFLGKF